MNIDILTDGQLAQLRDLLDGAERILVLGHKSPDGDAIGSCLGWAAYLQRQWGKQARIVVPDAFPDFLRWMPGTQTIMRYDKRPDEVRACFDEADLIFCLDFADAGRVQDMAPLLTACKARKVMIDHHLNPSLDDAALIVSHPEACSTAELVFRVVWQLGGFDDMDRQTAVPLYTGMMTDTGGFTYNSSRPEIYYIIGQLLTKGFDKDKIYRNVFNNYSVWAIRLRGYLMSQKLNYLPDYHAAYYSLTVEEMKRFHYVKGDQEGMVNEPLRIKGLRLSISLREDDHKDNLIWVSLRSVDSFPCNEMAARFFNGGGHLNASGGHLDCSMEEAEQKVREALKAYEDLLKA